MKRIMLLFLASLMLIIALCSCSEEQKPHLQEVFDKIKSEVTLSEMNELTQGKQLDRYYGITTDEVEQFAGGINNSGVKQEEIVLIMAADSESAEKIKTALENRRESKYNENKNYNPEQAEIIEKSKVQTNGMYVSLIISENSDKITEIYKSELNF